MDILRRIEILGERMQNMADRERGRAAAIRDAADLAYESAMAFAEAHGIEGAEAENERTRRYEHAKADEVDRQAADFERQAADFERQAAANRNNRVLIDGSWSNDLNFMDDRTVQDAIQQDLAVYQDGYSDATA